MNPAKAYVKHEKHKKRKKFFKAVLCLLLVAVLAAGGYCGYVIFTYSRIADNLTLAVENNNNGNVKIGTTYTALTYNIGFAAYTPDFGFFMDGGTESRAKSAQSVVDTMNGIKKTVADSDCDIALIEEVDTYATRSHYIDQRAILLDAMPSYDTNFAFNYDCKYLPYPILKPIGKSKSGLLTLSKFKQTSAVRRSLPIETGLTKLLDLDRCYTVTRMPTENGKELVVYTVHLSAYISNEKTSGGQIDMLVKDMKAEYENGNYVLCGGDFNRDLLLGNEDFGREKLDLSWTKPFPTEKLENTGLSLKVAYDSSDRVASCRNADGPYSDTQYLITPDGFIVSDNITVGKLTYPKENYEYSDHNPVLMEFTLN